MEFKSAVPRGSSVPIKVSLPDGKIVDAVSFETSPMDIASGISKGLAARMVVATVRAFSFVDQHTCLLARQNITDTSLSRPPSVFTLGAHSGRW